MDGNVASKHVRQTKPIMNFHCKLNGIIPFLELSGPNCIPKLLFSSHTQDRASYPSLGSQVGVKLMIIQCKNNFEMLLIMRHTQEQKKDKMVDMNAQPL